MITACEKKFYRVINCSGALLNVKYTSINISQVQRFFKKKDFRFEAYTNNA